MERVATLWVGTKLSYLERLCLKSFADVDQKPIFYHYDPVEDIPDFVEARDAREIFDPGEIIRDPISRSAAQHADLFRLKLLRETEYIWIDADAYALKPFETLDGYLFGQGFRRVRRVLNGVVALPKDSQALDLMLQFAFESDLMPPWWTADGLEAYRSIYGQSTVWSLPLGSFGPELWYHYLNETNELEMAISRLELYAIPLRFRKLWDDPDISKLDFLEWWSKTSIHFYGSWFRRIMSGKKKFNQGSLIDVLTKKHGVDPSDFPL